MRRSGRTKVRVGREPGPLPMVRLTRRTLAAACAVRLLVPACVTASTGSNGADLVMWNGWILRRSDLEGQAGDHRPQ